MFPHVDLDLGRYYWYTCVRNVAGLIFLILSLTCKLIVLVLELCFMIISFPFLCIAEGFLCLMSDRDVADGLLETLVGIVPMGSDDDSVISLV
ncbi:unnamed protein product [Somion occarium]